MEFITQELANYCNEHTNPENELLQDLNRQTNLKIMMPRMLSGHLQGRFLSMISHMIKPELILEIGTYTGYSALCMAEGLVPNGKIITLDINAEIESFVRTYFAKSELNSKIDYRIGNALEIIPQLNESFDLVFIDADKINYLNYYNLIIDKVKTGGYIIADNVLWSGRILEEKKDKDTQAICAFNDFVMNDVRVDKVMTPIRDGLYLIRKK
jgi:caffeoyl-CoA O-methyltransferase